MAEENKGGGPDLDIFEGLGKKKAPNAAETPAPSKAATDSLTPPPPPSSLGLGALTSGSTSKTSGAGRSGETSASPAIKQTLLGVSEPPPPPSVVPPPPSDLLSLGTSAPSGAESSGFGSGAHPPPPGRGALANVVPSPPQPGGSVPPPRAAKKPGLDMDWDDDEQTHVLDRNEGDELPPLADLANLKGGAKAESGASAKGGASDLGGFADLGKGRTSSPSTLPRAAGSSAALPPPPPPPSMAAVGGLPNAPLSSSASVSSSSSGSAFARASGLAVAAPGPIRAQPAAGSGPGAKSGAGGKAAEAAVEAAPASRSGASRGGLAFGIGLGVVAIGAAVIANFVLPRTGKLAVNVMDSKGGNVDHVEIFVDGKKECGTSPCLVERIPSGNHGVKVLAEGYEPAERAVIIESRKGTSMDFSLAGASAGTGIRVNGSQPGFKISVDGKEVGALPQELRDLTPGEHAIRIAGSERYQPLEKTINVQKDVMEDLGSVTLKVLKGKATISLGTPGAKVYIVSGTDRRDLPSFPISVDIDTTKSWELEATKPGLEEYRQLISFDDGQAEKAFNVVLFPKQAGGGTGTTGGGTTGAGKGPKTGGGGESTSTAAMDAFLNINSVPASTVVLDGKPLGNTPKIKVPVSAGSHTVVFVNTELGLKKSMTVNVTSGQTQPVIGKLRE